MATPAAPRPMDPSSVVLLLSTDESLIDELATGLNEREPDVELQVVNSLDTLDSHLERLRPDAVLLDTGSLPEKMAELNSDTSSLAKAPVILLSVDMEPWKRLTKHLNAVDHIARNDGYLEAVASALRVAQRTAGYEGRIQETVQHYRDILEASSDGIFVLVGDNFTFVNESFAATLGRTAEELLDEQGIIGVTLADDRHVLQEELARVAVAGGRRELIEARLLDKEGKSHTFEMACRSSVVEGRRAIVGVARDVTEERELADEVDRARQRAAQIERLRALGELAAGVAHDFNNVLETVLGRLGLAREKLKNGESIVEDLEVIETAARDGAVTVQRVREFSRPTGSDTWHDVDLRSIVQDAVEFIRTKVPSRVRLDVDLRETPIIRGNAAELREVLLNLLTNALDAIDGKGAVTLRCFDQGGQSVVEVQDTGCGMEPEVQRRVFEPFFTTKGKAGTGLGLSVTHGILRRHDAQILLESDPGQGTRFRLIFPAIEKVAPRRRKLGRGAMAITVVDDDPSVGELMKDLLEDLGHEVTVQIAVNETLAFLADNPVDLLITDLDLGGMSGWQLARSVRQIQPQIVVGLITGWPLGATDEELKSRGVDFVLAKPFSIDALTQALERVRESR